MIIAIDQGTTTTKALAIEPSTGQVVSKSSVSNAVRFPEPGYVEQDAAQLWEAVKVVVSEVSVGRATDISGLALANQRESVIAWSRTTGEPIAPVLGWQDSRTAEFCAGLSEHQDKISEITGLTLDPMFSAPKFRWLFDHVRAQGHNPSDVAMGTVDSWLVFKLTGQHLIEAGNASRTLLMNLETGNWDPWLLQIFGVDVQSLPRVVPSNAGFGAVLGGIEALEHLEGVPLLAVLADSHAALLVHDVPGERVAKATYGTGTSVMATTKTVGEGFPISTTVAWQFTEDTQYAKEGNIVASGAALDWTARLLGCPNDSIPGKWLANLAQSVESTSGVHIVPGFSGLGAPHWDRDATGLICGLSLGSSPNEVARAAFEAVAHQVCDVVEAMEGSTGQRIEVLVADGGASSSDFLMQLQADFLGTRVVVSSIEEASAYGAAKAAALVLGHPHWQSPQPRAVFTPKISENVRTTARASWEFAVQRASSNQTSRRG